MPQDSLDHAHGLPQPVQDARGQMANGMEAERPYPCPFAQRPHEVHPLLERLAVLFRAKAAFLLADEDMRMPGERPMLLPPAQSLEKLSGHGQPVIFQAAALPLAGTKADPAIAEVHIFPAQAEKLAAPRAFDII